MSCRLLLLVRLLLAGIPTCADAAACIGFLNQSEQGYKLEGDKLEKSGPTVAAGTQLEFNGMTQVKSRAFLTRARSDVIYDAQNVEVTAGCDLPNRPPPQAH